MHHWSYNNKVLNTLISDLIYKLVTLIYKGQFGVLDWYNILFEIISV